MRRVRSILSSAIPPDPPLLRGLVGQTVLHTRVAARGTWTVTERGTVLHARIQRLDGDPVGLRDARVVGARIAGAGIGVGQELWVALEGRGRLVAAPRWSLEGPYGALLAVDDDGETRAVAAGAPRFATAERIDEFSRSTPSGIEERLAELGREGPFHPGQVVEVLAAAGALEDEEFAARGPLLLGRMLARGELRAGFVVNGAFRAWELPLVDVLEHVAWTWGGLGGRTPGRDMIAWFALSPAGREALGPPRHP